MANVDRIASKIHHLAARQHGHVTRAQLLELGLSSPAIGRRIAAGELIRVYAGVYAVGYVRPEARARAAAAVLACGESAVLSHGSAAALWGMGKWPWIPEVIARGHRRRPGIHTHRCLKLTPRDLRRHYDIRVTSPARTALDLAPRITLKRLIRVVNDSENEDYLRRQHLMDVLERNPRHPGASNLKYVIGLDPTRSGFEDDFPAFCATYGLPRPRMNANVAGYTVDGLFPEHKLIVELDSWAYHRDRQSFEGDRERDAATLAADHVTIRLTRERQRRDPQREADRLHRILKQRGP